jgi:signal transduction histidine kinase
LRKSGGSGLGLYIVKEWTEAMGGEVWLESELNQGSTFYVAVPMQSVSSN